MMFHRLGLINKNQRGFTLIELMLAIAISGIITGGITMTIFSVVDGSARTNNHMIVVRQVQNAGYWVSHDAQMAQIVEPDEDEDTGFPLTLTWTEWDGTVNEVTYTIVDSEFRRSHSINGTTETIVAQYIDVSIDPDTGKPKTNCYLYKCAICGEELASLAELEEHFDIEHPLEEELQYENGALTFTVTATVGGGSQEQSETRTYEIVPRPGS